MRVAICLAGYFDSLTDPASKGVDGYNHLYNHVISKADHVDVFAHTWDVEKKDTIAATYGSYLKSLQVEPQIDFTSKTVENRLDTITYPSKYSHPRIVFSQFYSVQRSFELLRDSHQHYDVVIKSRFDVGRINRNTSVPYPVQCINFDPYRDMAAFYTADWPYLDSEGPADMWFYSSYENMIKFAQIYNTLLQEYKPQSPYAEFAGDSNGGLNNAIKYYKWFLIQNGLWQKKQLLQTTWE